MAYWYSACAICGVTLQTNDPKKYYCSSCYADWKEDIISKAEWVKVCQNSESQRRRQEIKDSGVLIYLGNEWDISTDGKLIPLDGYDE